MTYEETKGIPITDTRVLPVTLKLVEEVYETLKRCKNNPDYLYTKTYTRTNI